MPEETQKSKPKKEPERESPDAAPVTRIIFYANGELEVVTQRFSHRLRSLEDTMDQDLSGVFSPKLWRQAVQRAVPHARFEFKAAAGSLPIEHKEAKEMMYAFYPELKPKPETKEEEGEGGDSKKSAAA